MLNFCQTHFETLWDEFRPMDKINYTRGILIIFAFLEQILLGSSILLFKKRQPGLYVCFRFGFKVLFCYGSALHVRLWCY